MPTQGGSIRLFRVAGIDVFLHWSWFLVAVYEVQVWRSMFSSPIWAALLYLGLFVLVTMHEFGHALACRQVGGRAERIVLWPLGGIAFVSPPPRAGAMLWSIAAGPMVNLLLLPILTYAQHAAERAGWVNTNADAYLILHWLWRINLASSIQSAADLSARRRPDRARPALVSVRANPEPVHCDRELALWAAAHSCSGRFGSNRSGSESWPSSFSARLWPDGVRHNI